MARSAQVGGRITLCLAAHRGRELPPASGHPHDRPRLGPRAGSPNTCPAPTGEIVRLAEHRFFCYGARSGACRAATTADSAAVGCLAMSGRSQ